MIGVYFLESGGLIKIGITTDAFKRMNSLQGMCPTKIAVVGFIEMQTRVETSILESHLHNRFHEYRHHREWFNPSDEILKYIQKNAISSVCDELNVLLTEIYNTVPKKTGEIDIGKRSVIAEIYQFVISNPDTTVRLIANSLGIYESVVKVHLNRLRQEGLVTRIRNA
jgi:hypothetical protein